MPWRFIIIEDKSIITFISDVSEMMPSISKQYETQQDRDWVCYNAPMPILICSQIADQTLVQIDLLDSVLAAQNTFLKPYELGLGTCYIGLLTRSAQRAHQRRRRGSDLRASASGRIGERDSLTHMCV